MQYELAWLNNKIGSAVSLTEPINNIYVCLNKETGEHDKRVIDNACHELVSGLSHLFNVEPNVIYTDSFVSIDFDKTKFSNIVLHLAKYEKDLTKGSFKIEIKGSDAVISSDSAEGLLYGSFRLIAKIKCADSIKELAECSIPTSPMRMLDHWDNIDGSIERGYSGNSFFFDNGTMLFDERIRDYVRLIASVGINAVCINNVNVRGNATKLITSEYRDVLSNYVEAFADYGIDLYLSLNFASPIELGNLSDCDPLNEKVIEWWTKTLSELHDAIPSLGGFLIKADSEGRPGPFCYGRDHADGANMLARIVKSYGWNIIWRCFVYNCKQDWRDTVTDRAKAQYDNFIELDGRFDDNVILQIKNGPMDFQIREPVSPLFGGLKYTNEMLEFQIAQEYTGQQKHVCYLIPEFKEVLDFNTYISNEGVGIYGSKVVDVVSHSYFGNSNCGVCAVTNTGNDVNWTGHDLAAANLYGFGRLAFDNSLTSGEIAEEWIRLTFGHDPKVIRNIMDILADSRLTYEKYSSPLGIGWMVNPGYHYGPNVDGYEFSEWGTYHRADKQGIGVDRTHNGTGYTKQYNEPLHSLYEDVATCPDELILFFHHVPYTYMLHSGKTVIQHIYDTHYEGAKEAERYLGLWKELEGLIEPHVFERTLLRFEEQLRSANEWRDHVVGYFRDKSGIPDEQGRV